MSNFTTALIISTLLIIPFFASSQVDPEFQPLADSFEVENPNAVQAVNIRYDDIDPQKQLFHMFLPDTEGTFPLVIFIHGGGFTGGNPGSVFSDPGRRANVKYFLDNGFAYASVGYRLIAEDTPDPDGVIKSLNDSKRALQFIRHYADDLHIDSEKIALMGTSAGAGTCLWLGSRSDMADPDASDPVLRASTRVSAVVANGSQSTYDIFKWETDIYNDFDGQGTNFTLDSIAEIMTEMRVSNFYGGIDSLYQIVHDPALIQYREDVDMLFHLSNDDPPLYISSQSGAVHPSEDVLHHSLHGNELYEVAITANISEVKADIPTQSINTTEGETANEFVLRQLNRIGSEPEVILSAASTNNVAVYPNPATTHFFINTFEEVNKVEVVTLSGEIVNANAYDGKVDTSNLRSGVYFVNMTHTNGIKTSSRLIIK